MKPTLTILTALLLAPLAGLPAAEPLSTFCNPLPTPNYPVGFLARSVTHGEPEARQGWILGKPLPDPIPLKIQFPISRLVGAGNDCGVVAEKQTAAGRDTADENDVETG